MAGNQRSGKIGKAYHTNRRRFIRTVGATMTPTAAGTASINATSGAENAADPGEQGVSNGGRIEIQGTGDAEESAFYAFSVSGDLSLDESRTAVDSAESLWLAGDLTEGYVSGEVRNGADGFFYSGKLERIDVDGEAAVSAFQGDYGLES